MNRTIRFRAWDTHTKTFIYFGGIPRFDDTLNTATFDCSPVLGEQDAAGSRFILEEFTGLHDKNGKEIYEGDIVYDILEDTRHVVKWFSSDDYPAFDLEPGFDGEINGFSEATNDREGLEVIGNIHENPDLIESGTKQQEA